MAEKRNAEIVSLSQKLSQKMEMCIPDVSQERILRNLPKESRLIFMCRYWHLDTIAEIAARYGLTESKENPS